MLSVITMGIILYLLLEFFAPKFDYKYNIIPIVITDNIIRGNL